MGVPLQILIVEDSENDALLLLRELRRGGYDPVYERVETAAGMEAALRTGKWDLIVSDYSMPHFNGVEALKLLCDSGLDLPFIFVSGTIGEDAAVEAMKTGAHDYIVKGNLKRLVPAVGRELREVKIRRERRQADEMVRYLAYYDSLTGLPNRTLFYDRVDQAILTSLRDQKQVSLLLMDLDRFKEINDTLGHYRGDWVLQQTGRRLRGCLRESDTVARLGGDEFAVLLPALSKDRAILTADRILAALQTPFEVDGLAVHAGASIGIALCPEHGTDTHTILQKADVAMYAAKQRGSGYAVYAPDLDRHSTRRLAIIGDLRQAIEAGQLFIMYQPQIRLDQDRCAGVEALVRWQHPLHGLITPDQFIPLAEQSGLIQPLTQWVLEASLRQWQAWRAGGDEIRVAVNLSARNLHDPKLPDYLERLFERYRMIPDGLVMEITESAIMLDPGQALAILRRLRGMGVGLAIDDFGTGYSSFGYLKKLPVQAIKIDRSFIHDLTANREDQMIVRSMIDLAHNLNLKVVAEGVETEPGRSWLANFGCDEAQGYFWSRPVTAGEMVRWLK